MGRPIRYTLVPLCFLLVMATWALIIQLAQFWRAQQYFLVFMDLLILGATILVALEAIAALQRARKEPRGPTGTSQTPAAAGTARTP
jgi:carbon starvation protein